MKVTMKKVRATAALVCMTLAFSITSYAHETPDHGTNPRVRAWSSVIGVHAGLLATTLSVGEAPLVAVLLTTATNVATTGPILADKWEKEHRQEVVVALREDAAAFIASDGEVMSPLLEEAFAAAREDLGSRYSAEVAESVTSMQLAEAMTAI